MNDQLALSEKRASATYYETSPCGCYVRWEFGAITKVRDCAKHRKACE
jgi:hypothetical protein